MEDNRKNPRCAVRWRSAIVTQEGGRQETIQCKTSDVSISGVSVICPRSLPLRHALSVYLLIDQGDEKHPQQIFEAQGEVMNNVLSGQQGGFRLGIQFVKFVGDSKQLLQKHLPKEAAPAAMRSAAAEVTAAADSAPVADAAPTDDVSPTTD